MTSPGQELKKEREARGISLKAIADATRITQRYLEAVESDRLDLLPGGFFIKGILRAYAGAVGLDEETSPRRIPARRRPESRGPRSVAETGFGRRQVKEADPVHGRSRGHPHRRRQLRRLFPVPAGENGSPSVRNTDFDRRSGTVRHNPSGAEAAPAAVAPQPEKGLRFEISFVQETWIQVYADGRLVLDGIRKAGNTAEVRAETELLIHLGNAGGLSYTLNGKPGKPFGSPGAVVKNIRITEADLASFVRDDGTGESKEAGDRWPIPGKRGRASSGRSSSC